LELIADLQKEMGMSVILITHDLGVIAEVCDEVAVMYAGRIVEKAGVYDLFANPRHAYTQGLLESIPRLDSTPKTLLKAIPGNVPGIADFKPGCRFAERSGREHSEAHLTQRPPVIEIAPGHVVEGCPVCAGLGLAISGAKNESGNTTQQHENQDRSLPSGSLESAQDYLARSARADCPASGSQGADSGHKEQLQLLAAWARREGKLIAPETWLAPEETGAEHRIYFDESRTCAIKITNTGLCGMTYRQGQPVSATPWEYLERWLRHNEVFEDAAWLEGVMVGAAGISLVIGQPWISGEVPSSEDIHTHMRDLGFDPCNEPESYYRRHDGLAALDCHEGNFIAGGDGKMYAIDVILVQADEKLKSRLGIAS
jgi:oligopeptide/dipeptide ABC transporter ATP-binding protein